MSDTEQNLLLSPLLPLGKAHESIFDIANRITLRGTSCSDDSSTQILAAMITSASREPAKQPKRCSHQNRRSANHPFLRPRQLIRRGVNRVFSA
jgi:hypothetical protein